MGNLYTPDQFADLVISEVEMANHAKTGDVLGLGKYHAVLAANFRVAITQALEKSITVVEQCKAEKIENSVPHIRKHLPE
jgi:hypothetical protein